MAIRKTHKNRFYILRPAVWLVVLLLLTMLLENFFQKQARRDIAITWNRVDYLVENTEGIQINHNTMANRRFTANTMTHYSQENRTLLEQVKFSSIESDKPLLRVSADQAELLADGNDILLRGNVQVLRGADADKDKIHMVTEFLHLIPDAELAKTDHAVTVFRMKSVANSTGMILNNQTGEIQLQSRVSANDRRNGR